MPSTPFIGVRISWLMFARNSLLARFAASAASLACAAPRLLPHAAAQRHDPGERQRDRGPAHPPSTTPARREPRRRFDHPDRGRRRRTGSGTRAARRDCLPDDLDGDTPVTSTRLPIAIGPEPAGGSRDRVGRVNVVPSPSMTSTSSAGADARCSRRPRIVTSVASGPFFRGSWRQWSAPAAAAVRSRCDEGSRPPAPGCRRRSRETRPLRPCPPGWMPAAPRRALRWCRPRRGRTDVVAPEDHDAANAHQPAGAVRGGEAEEPRGAHDRQGERVPFGRRRRRGCPAAVGTNSCTPIIWRSSLKRVAGHRRAPGRRHRPPRPPAAPGPRSRHEGGNALALVDQVDGQMPLDRRGRSTGRSRRLDELAVFEPGEEALQVGRPGRGQAAVADHRDATGADDQRELARAALAFDLDEVAGPARRHRLVRLRVNTNIPPCRRRRSAPTRPGHRP